MSDPVGNDRLRNFVFAGLLLSDDFDRLEKAGISVRASGTREPIHRVDSKDFSPQIVFQSEQMSEVYGVSYCLENSVRQLIVDRLAERHGIDWWNTKVPKKIREAVEKLKTKETVNKYHAQRSSAEIGYTMFGNLGQIIIENWDDFSDIIPNQQWLTSRMNDLEMSRNIIMHTGILPTEEIERIETISRDWVRQVG